MSVCLWLVLSEKLPGRKRKENKRRQLSGLHPFEHVTESRKENMLRISAKKCCTAQTKLSLERTQYQNTEKCSAFS